MNKPTWEYELRAMLEDYELAYSQERNCIAPGMEVSPYTRDVADRIVAFVLEQVKLAAAEARMWP